MVTLIKEIGTDALFALRNVAAEMDDALGTEYLERVKAFHRHCARNDLAVAVAQTDSKGDRSKRPSEQEHPDHYVRIVERRSDGIVVRGAKVHTSVSVNSNELIVLPTRNFDERDAEYAVAFATPMNTAGAEADHGGLHRRSRRYVPVPHGVEAPNAGDANRLRRRLRALGAGVPSGRASIRRLAGAPVRGLPPLHRGLVQAAVA